MLLNELLKVIQPVQVTGDSRIEITGVNIDSRLSKPDSCLWRCAARRPMVTPISPLPFRRSDCHPLRRFTRGTRSRNHLYQVKDSEDAVGRLLRHSTVIRLHNQSWSIVTGTNDNHRHLII